MKEHTLTHLAEYLEEFERNAIANGAQVHWARDAAEHNAIVHDILSERGARTLVKSEVDAHRGVRTQPVPRARAASRSSTPTSASASSQLDDEPPSHIVVPAIHLKLGDVATGLRRARSAPTAPDIDDPPRSRRAAREHLRARLPRRRRRHDRRQLRRSPRRATIVVCTNEGNADSRAWRSHLSTSCRVGIEKVIPRIEDLARVPAPARARRDGAADHACTPRTSTGRASGQRAARRARGQRAHASSSAASEFWSSLKCIRCGACMNTCPVYRRSGGHSYGATYSGPIGVIIDPAYDLRKYGALPFASTLERQLHGRVSRCASTSTSRSTSGGRS